MKRKKTKKVKVGNVYIGGDSPVTIQSMTNTKTANIKDTIEQIKLLEKAGCEIIRVAVPDEESAQAIKKIKKEINIPLVADIHFDYKLAIKSIEHGADKIRINPGNVGGIDKIKEIIKAAKHYNIPIRVGVNSGSLERDILEKYKKPCAEALAESAIRNVKLLEDLDFFNIVVSVKSSNVLETIESYKILSRSIDYPLHLGVTESGTLISGTVKSSIGIGLLLYEGIGDTIRVSLTDDPVNEIKVAREILKSLGLRKGIEIVSCPTCGRTNINLIELAQKITRELENYTKPIKVAIMGCAVNGPGEAKEADIGIAAGKGDALIFKKGEIIKKVKESEILEELLKEIEKL
ncbi:flavodoxin-dependent (E)-4-hydroxy-3-methylbut-2-enyl-diphosphate synthase [Caloramator sp. CAR-1]|uniref:flavodoxin-dependent (E)-4-hydroxy-3-methylbut-2-enyl-diphosphate synthase n=1 Tax=Caloramator sp. CAR-1 TaxID=3062777 RepID=UPI0026E193AF|nr:flavodoxin-dependent (E)-4-hydroxy-3-methylbut-2-enyl-diphosphate synthase [Caloramator sp. CAR-1]MDO6354089.1 flavodoxin-dependent (E)-4-hydroxy-3-methylbut-2-enyl-diphosphate synthase [Caloramator sp. CAR-1]